MSMDEADRRRIEKLRLASTEDWHTATKSKYPNYGYATLPEPMADCEDCDIDGLADWNTVTDVRNKTDNGHEGPWFRFLDGANPDYPAAILRQAYGQMSYRWKMIRENVLLLEYDPRGTEAIDPARVDIRNVHEHHWMTVNPVIQWCSWTLSMPISSPASGSTSTGSTNTPAHGLSAPAPTAA